ncbi:TPM domain-containing protein [Agromyces soli]
MPLAVASVAVALLAGPGAAWATDPVSFGASPVVDQAGVLGAQLAEVEQALDAAGERSGRQLFVAYVDDFTNPESAAEWAADTAIGANMGAEDYLLAVAVDGRSYDLSVDQNAALSDAELERIRTEVTEPLLHDEKWAEAAIATANAIADSGTGGLGFGGASAAWAWWLLVGVVVAVGVVLFVLARRRRANRQAGPGGAGPDGAGGPPPPSIEELRRRAGSALVQIDDALKTSEEELGFAVASYGEAATAPFRDALATAKGKTREAFALQQKLDDHLPDTEAQRREWYTAIIALADEADRLLDAQAASFDALRELERNAPAALESVRAAASTAEAGAATSAQRLAALQAQYAATALDPIADNPQQARARLDFARTSIDEAQSAIARSAANEAAVDIRAAEEAVAQAQLLAAAVERLAADLATADRQLADGVADLERDVQAARGLQADGLAALADRTASEAQALREAAATPGRDPLALKARLDQANGAIDQAVAGARDAVARAERAAAQLQRAVASAKARISAAEDYIVARRGAIGPEARTRLAEAGRLAVEAETGAAADPVAALATAQHAERLADDALRLARTNVGDFGDQYGEGGFGDWAGPSRPANGNGDVFGALLGGILIDDLLGGDGRSSGWGGGATSGWGGGSSTSWGGGSRRSGGGGFGGGRRSAGSFGGSGTRSRRGGGGRF